MKNAEQNERDFLRADAAALRSLLSEISEENFTARLGLESRLRDVESEIAAFDAHATPEHAVSEPLGLLFGGKPVVGSRGIDSEFASVAMGAFQDLVAKVFALAHGLGQRGPVRNKGASTLYITDVAHGSFGFVFEELDDQQSLVATPLASALAETSSLLKAFADPDEERFQATVADLDDRVLTTTSNFFTLMRQNQATLGLRYRSGVAQFDSETIARAAERGSSTSVSAGEEKLRGELRGILPESRQFEFRPDGGDIVRGGIAIHFVTGDGLTNYPEFLNRRSVATVQVKRVLRGDTVVRQSYVLTALAHDDNRA